MSRRSTLAMHLKGPLSLASLEDKGMGSISFRPSSCGACSSARRYRRNVDQNRKLHAATGRYLKLYSYTHACHYVGSGTECRGLADVESDTGMNYAPDAVRAFVHCLSLTTFLISGQRRIGASHVFFCHSKGLQGVTAADPRPKKRRQHIQLALATTQPRVTQQIRDLQSMNSLISYPEWTWPTRF
jgi:hypothetical protein